MSLANKALSVFSRDILLFFSNLVTAIVVARSLGPEILGIWVVINLVPTYVDMLLRSKVDISAVYFLGIKKYGIGDITLAIHVCALISSLVALTPFFFYFDDFSLFLLKNAEKQYSSHLLVILLVIPLNFLYLNYLYLHTFHEDAKRINYMVLSRFLLSSLITIVSLLMLDTGLYGLIIAAICGLATSVLIGALTFKHEKASGPIINVALIKDLISYAYKVYLAGLMVNLNAYIVQLFVVHYLLPSNLAYFSIAQQLCLLLDKIIGSLNTFLFPRITKGTHQENINLTSKVVRVASVVMFIVFCFSCLFIYPAINVLYGNEYLPVVTLFLIMLPGVILSSIAGVFSVYFTGVGKAEIVVWIAVIPFITQLTLGFLIIPSYGIYGAALVLLIGLTITGFSQLFFFKYLTKTSLKDILFITYEDLRVVIDFFISIVRKITYRI